MPYSDCGPARTRTRDKETVLRFVHSVFPRGRLGAGLLILRTALGLVVLARGVLILSSSTETTTFALVTALISGAAGALLIVGLVTSCASAITAALYAGTSLVCAPIAYWDRFDYAFAPFLSAATAVSLLLLGPGAFSADARLFGPREIVIPPGTTSRGHPPSSLGM